jgi:hypothetical protein
VDQIVDLRRLSDLTRPNVNAPSFS